MSGSDDASVTFTDVQPDIEVTAVDAARDGKAADLRLKVEAGWIYRLTIDVLDASGKPAANRVAWYTLNRLRG